MTRYAASPASTPPPPSPFSATPPRLRAPAAPGCLGAPRTRATGRRALQPSQTGLLRWALTLAAQAPASSRLPLRRGGAGRRWPPRCSASRTARSAERSTQLQRSPAGGCSPPLRRRRRWRAMRRRCCAFAASWEMRWRHAATRRQLQLRCRTPRLLSVTSSRPTWCRPSRRATQWLQCQAMPPARRCVAAPQRRSLRRTCCARRTRMSLSSFATSADGRRLPAA